MKIAGKFVSITLMNNLDNILRMKVVLIERTFKTIECTVAFILFPLLVTGMQYVFFFSFILYIELYLMSCSLIITKNVILKINKTFLFNRLRQIDTELMKRLHQKVNIVPIIAKADTLTAPEVKKLKQRILSDIEENEIQV